MAGRCSRLWVLSLLLHWSAAAFGQPVDLFPDEPALADGFVRLGAWNVRHMNVAGPAEDYFVGETREDDLQILTASIAKAISDLKLDLVVLIEVQPRPGDVDCLEAVRRHLESLQGGWHSDATQLQYDEPDDPYGNLQFGLLWNTSRGVFVDRSKNRVLEELRQPRLAGGGLLRRDQRAPWFVPVTFEHGAMRLEIDLLALHLKSGGSPPQASEVEAVASFIREHQSAHSPRHLIVCGDWNIRPDESDQGRGRPRLRKLIGAGGPSPLRLLTVGDLRPDLDEWSVLLEGATGSARRIFQPFLPYSHVDLRDGVVDSLLDHMAISRSLDELFDHPVELVLANGERDLRPGIEIVQPSVSEADYVYFTDHLPVVLTLRVDAIVSERPPAGIQIVGLMPNPVSAEGTHEYVILRNRSNTAVPLKGWRLQDRTGECWNIDDVDLASTGGQLYRGRTVKIFRRGRRMTLSNDGDLISLFDSSGKLIDARRYGSTRTGERLMFTDQ